MQWRCERLIKLAQRGGAAYGLEIDAVGEQMRLGADLSLQRAQKIGQINVAAGPRSFEVGRARREVEGHADGDGGVQRCGPGARLGVGRGACIVGVGLSEKLQEHVAPERESDRPERARRMASCQLPHNPAQIFSLARVIGARLEVGLT